ncbi:MAG: sugar phosphate isomerase/epimerase [Chloroflexi bacterium]|nr:sugar phosphate isomerase/epimerase [Chloroflexota bacterium]
MKLSLDTYSICQTMGLDHLLQVLTSNGFAAVEFRCEAGQAHGVELEAGPARRRELRHRIEQAGLRVSVLSTGQRFESPDPQVRALAIERSKRFVELADDMGATGIRVFGNDFPPDVPREEVVRYVGESLRQIGEFAEGSEVNVLLEMHGQFYYWEYALGAVQIADHPHVALNYNSDPRDLVDGSVRFVMSKVGDRLRHVHLHDLAEDFPYVELFRELKARGYDRYLSLELSYSGGDPDNIIRLSAALYRALMAQVG